MPTKEWIAQNQDRLRAYRRQYYYRNRNREIERITRRAAEIVTWFVKEVRNNLICKQCGENHPGCLDFHHRDPSEKELDICQMVQSGWSKRTILKEIEKCDVLCANCHRKLHFDLKVSAGIA